MQAQDSLERLAEFFIHQQPLFVLTGAGCSTDSGIPDYRDHDGSWKHSQPIQFKDFIEKAAMRKRYWLRSMNGWPHIANAKANTAHHALARLEQAGYIQQLVTQNVDGLHQQAGSNTAINLHGQLQTVTCLDCNTQQSREQVQSWLRQHNAEFIRSSDMIKPDGDANTEFSDLSKFQVPECRECGGMLKPDVVFFGESVPRPRVDTAMQQLKRAKGMLAIGSSLMVFSGYRFCRAAKDWDIPCVALNLGRTRADDELLFKVESPCAEVLNNILLKLNC